MESTDLFTAERRHLGMEQGRRDLGIGHLPLKLGLSSFNLDHLGVDRIPAPPFRIKLSRVSSSRSILFSSERAISREAEPSIRRRFISRVNSPQNSSNGVGSIK